MKSSLWSYQAVQACHARQPIPHSTPLLCTNHKTHSNVAPNTLPMPHHTPELSYSVFLPHCSLRSLESFAHSQGLYTLVEHRALETRRLSLTFLPVVYAESLPYQSLMLVWKQKAGKFCRREGTGCRVCGGLREPQQGPVPQPDLKELVLQEHRQLQS